jgi:hypothetical protein
MRYCVALASSALQHLRGVDAAPATPLLRPDAHSASLACAWATQGDDACTDVPLGAELERALAAREAAAQAHIARMAEKAAAEADGFLSLPPDDAVPAPVADVAVAVVPPAAVEAAAPAGAEPAEGAAAAPDAIDGAIEAAVPGAASPGVAAPPPPTPLTETERRLLDWHWANLEYGAPSLRAAHRASCFIMR